MSECECEAEFSAYFLSSSSDLCWLPGFLEDLSVAYRGPYPRLISHQLASGRSAARLAPESAMWFLAGGGGGGPRKPPLLRGQGEFVSISLISHAEKPR